MSVQWVLTPVEATDLALISAPTAGINNVCSTNAELFSNIPTAGSTTETDKKRLKKQKEVSEDIYKEVNVIFRLWFPPGAHWQPNVWSIANFVSYNSRDN